MLNAQESLAAQEPLRATIRPVDTTRSPEVQIAIDGHLLQSFTLEGSAAAVSLAKAKGKARGSVVFELSDQPGALVFSTGLFGPQIELNVGPASGDATTQLHARGRTVRVTRDTNGRLSVVSDK